MTKIVFYSLLAILFAACNSSNDKFVVHGIVKKMGDGEIYFIPAGDNAKPDTVKVKGDQFVYEGTIKEPTFYMVNFGPNQNPSFLVIEKGNITLTYELDAMNSLEVKGGKEQTIYTGFLQACKPIFSSMDSLGKVASANEANPSILNGLQANFSILENELKQKQLNFIETNKQSIASAFVGDNYLNSKMDTKIEEVEQLYNMLDTNVKATYFGKQIFKRAERMKATQIGHMSPQFELNDLNENRIALSSLKGNVTLIDFWASWCGPCRQENPNVVKAYNQFHAKGFDIIGVSLDTQKEQWQAAIAKDGMQWKQVSDLKGWNSEVAMMYGVQSIPMNFLLDKEGKIIAKDLRGDALMMAVQNAIGN
jgi:peroxiredoxin